jgi:IS605 OrfB family transposase
LKNDKVIFGGKKLFIDRCQNKISKEEFQLKKLRPVYSIGESSRKGNRKFLIVTENHIIFKPTKEEHFLLEINPSKNYQNYLIQLSQLAEEKKIPIDFKLGLEYIYISFNLNKLKNERKIIDKIKDRYFAIDMNPNYVGYTIIDWIDGQNYKIVDKGCFSLKDLNDYDDSLKEKGFSSESKERKYISNKRNYEISDIAHKLEKIANHYQCENFVMEDLTIPSKDNGKGKRFNRLCNQQWCRNRFTNIIKKLCKLDKIKILEVIPNYSSVIGNLVYRSEKLPDFILASIEISRRGYEFNHQYILKDKERKKNIVFGNFDEDKVVYVQSLEELNISEQFSSFQELYDIIKKSKTRYRFPLEQCFMMVFRKKHIKTYQTLYKFV